MRLSQQTFHSTAKYFGQSVHSHKIKMTSSEMLDAWSQIVLGKNYSEVMPYFKDSEYIDCITVTKESICNIVKIKGQAISISDAYQLFANAIAVDLPALSTGMFELLKLIKANNQCGLIITDRGLGIIDKTSVGYLVVSELGLDYRNSHEKNWLNSSASLAASVINLLVGVDIVDLFVACSHLRTAQDNDACRWYFTRRIKECANAFSEVILSEYEPEFIKIWELDFDTIRNYVFDVIERDVRNSASPYFPQECGLGALMIDHITGRLWDTLKWVFSEASVGNIEISPREKLTNSAEFAINTILRLSEC